MKSYSITPLSIPQSYLENPKLPYNYYNQAKRHLYSKFVRKPQQGFLNKVLLALQYLD